MEEAVDKIGFGVFQVLLSLYLGSTGVSSVSVCCVFVHCAFVCALCSVFSMYRIVENIDSGKHWRIW